MAPRATAPEPFRRTQPSCSTSCSGTSSRLAAKLLQPGLRGGSGGGCCFLARPIAHLPLPGLLLVCLIFEDHLPGAERELRGKVHIRARRKELAQPLRDDRRRALREVPLPGRQLLLILPRAIGALGLDRGPPPP